MTPTAIFEAPSEGGSQNRVDGRLKVTGQMPYAADIVVEGTLHVAVVRSPQPHARIVSIDAAAARALPGVRCVLTGDDVAAIRTGRALRDTPLLAVGKTRFAGEMVAAVAADTPEVAAQAAVAIDVEYQPLPAVFDAEAALAAEAPAVHDEPWNYAGAARGADEPKNVIARTSWSTGHDVEAALGQADRVFERTFRTQRVHQGYIEPHCCTVAFDSRGTVSVWSCNKAPYRMRQQLAVTFDLPEDDIHAFSPAIGGDFGGKGSPMDIPLCLELSRRTGRPVRMLRSYVEELLAGDPSPGSAITIRMGVSNEGRIQALHVLGIFNAGAYGGYTPGAPVRGTSWTSYRLPVAHVENVRVYTNEVPNGNMRAPSAPQNAFAMEAMMDFVARGLGLDPFEFRRRNLLTDGETTLMGNVWPESRGIATLDLAERSSEFSPPAGAPATMRIGRGVALYDRPTHAPQRTSLRLTLLPHGSVEAQLAIQETGTGSHTMLQRVLATALGIDREQVSLRCVGTQFLPWDEGVGGSRVTVSSAEAGVIAAQLFMTELRRNAAEVLGTSEDRLEPLPSCRLRGPDGREFSLAELAARGAQVDVVGEVKGGGHGEGATSFCVQVAHVGVDVETGAVKLLKMLSVHDVAEILDPLLHRGQIQGGIGMGIGFALSEDLNLSDGRVAASHLGEYKLPTIADMPPLEVILLPGGKGVGARNVKSIGEMGNVPAAAAIANAVSDALGACVDSLPITAEKVLSAMQSSGQAG